MAFQNKQWLHNANSRFLPSNGCWGIVRSAFKKKVIVIQNSATYISWIDLALGIISLKSPTLFCRGGFPVVFSDVSGFYDEFLYAKYPLKNGKIQEKLNRETRLRKFSQQYNMPLGVVPSWLSPKAPIGLNLLVCAKTGRKMVVDIISRSKHS